MNLHNFKCIFKNKFKEELKNAKLQNIVLLNNNNTLILPDIKLQIVFQMNWFKLNLAETKLNLINFNLNLI